MSSLYKFPLDSNKNLADKSVAKKPPARDIGENNNKKDNNKDNNKSSNKNKNKNKSESEIECLGAINSTDKNNVNNHNNDNKNHGTNFDIKLTLPVTCQSQPPIPLTTVPPMTATPTTTPMEKISPSKEQYNITPTNLELENLINNSMRNKKKQKTFQDDQFIYIPVEKKKLQDAVRVRNYVTNSIFRCVKFINTRSMLRKVMGMVSKGMDIDPNKRQVWEINYEREVKYAINNKRNSVSQDMKKALLGTYQFFFELKLNY